MSGACCDNLAYQTAQTAPTNLSKPVRRVKGQGVPATIEKQAQHTIYELD